MSPLPGVQAFSPGRRPPPALFCVAGLLFAALAGAQTAPPSALTILPFGLYHNRVYLSVRVNGAGPLAFIVDTGAAMTGLSEARAHELNLRTQGDAELVGNGDTALRVGLLKDLVVGVGAVEIHLKSAVVVPFKEFERREGRSVDGVLGVDLFRKYVVEIDYAAKTLALRDCRTFKYSGDGETVQLNLRRGAALFPAQIEASRGKTLDAELAFDGGTYSALRLYRRFVESHGLLGNTGPALPSFGFGLGGEFAEAQGRVKALRIGKLRIVSPVTGFSRASGGATAGSGYDGTVGGEILRRFKVIFDYAGARVILEPSAIFSEPQLADASGLILTAEGGDFSAITVEHVLPHTPASEAGLQGGDVVESIDYIPAGRLGLEAIRKLFQRPASYALEIRRGGQIIAVGLRTRDLT